MARSNPIAFIESAYAIEADESAWLDAVAEAARGVFTHNIGAYALTYDASDVADCKFGALMVSGIESPKLLRLLRYDMAQAYRTQPQVVDAVFRKTLFGSSGHLPLTGSVAAARDELTRVSGAEILGLNGVNVDGRGLHVGVLVSRSVAKRARPELLARLSSHLAAAFRLRARIGPSEAMERAEAVFEPHGKVAHAKGMAKLRDARRSLAAAASQIDRLRGAVGKRDPARAVAQWRALVEARWSLVDHFERDGKRYIVAHRNDPAVAPFALLSRRERQVVALAALGHANKMIGYELGISVSTASVLLSRAARKLGVRSRAALVEAYTARSRPASAGW